MIGSIVFAIALGHAQVRPFPFVRMLNFVVIKNGDQGMQLTEDAALVQNENQWDNIRGSIGVTDEINKSLKELHGPLHFMDWHHDQIVIVRGPEVMTSGYNLKIDKILKFSDDRWNLHATLIPPPRNQLNAQVISRPYSAIRMARMECKPRLDITVKKPR